MSTNRDDALSTYPTARAEAALTHPATLLALATLLVNDLVFKWPLARHLDYRQTQRPRLGNLRTTSPSPPTNLPRMTQPDSSESRLGNRLHRTSPPLRRLQHLRTVTRRGDGCILPGSRNTRRFAIRSLRFDRHTVGCLRRNFGLGFFNLQQCVHKDQIESARGRRRCSSVSRDEFRIPSRNHCVRTRRPWQRCRLLLRTCSG